MTILGNARPDRLTMQQLGCSFSIVTLSVDISTPRYCGVGRVTMTPHWRSGLQSNKRITEWHVDENHPLVPASPRRSKQRLGHPANQPGHPAARPPRFFIGSPRHRAKRTTVNRMRRTFGDSLAGSEAKTRRAPAKCCRGRASP